MKYTRFIPQHDVASLQLEVISQELRIHLTRILETRLPSENTYIIWQNRVINKSRRLVGLSPYILDSGDDEFYLPVEHAWHNGEFEVVFRRLNTIQFAEFICELIEMEFFTIPEINNLLEQEKLSFRVSLQNDGELLIDVIPLEVLESEAQTNEHPNIRVLIRRMENALSQNDYPAVVHASASVFETMAKDIIGIPEVQNKPLGRFFAKYRNNLLLPDEILDYILNIYNLRNTMPLAGHGSTQVPDVSRESAIVLSEITKAFVQMEYQLHLAEIQAGG